MLPVGPFRRAAIEAAWHRLVRKQFRIRRLMRIWGLLGQFLKEIPEPLRRRLQREIKKE